jgi:hypothetical protein
MVGAKHRGWKGAVAHVAMIALLFRALLVPAGCPVPLDAGALTSSNSPAIICSVHGGQDAGGAADPDGGAGKKSHHTSPACASACCAVAVPVAASIDLPSAGQPVFHLETWHAPAGAAGLALRNRGPPVTLTV